MPLLQFAQQATELHESQSIQKNLLPNRASIPNSSYFFTCLFFFVVRLDVLIIDLTLVLSKASFAFVIDTVKDTVIVKIN